MHIQLSEARFLKLWGHQKNYVLWFSWILSSVLSEERKLGPHEYPLVLQLNWGNDLREGRFLLKGEHDKTIPVSVCVGEIRAPWNAIHSSECLLIPGFSALIDNRLSWRWLQVVCKSISCVESGRQLRLNSIWFEFSVLWPGLQMLVISAHFDWNSFLLYTSGFVSFVFRSGVTQGPDLPLFVQERMHVNCPLFNTCLYVGAQTKPMILCPYCQILMRKSWLYSYIKVFAVLPGSL